MKILFITYGGALHKFLEVVEECSSGLVVLMHSKFKPYFEKDYRKLKGRRIKFVYADSIYSFLNYTLTLSKNSNPDLILANCPISAVFGLIAKLRTRKNLAAIMCSDFIRSYMEGQANMVSKLVKISLLYLFMRISYPHSFLIVLSDYLKKKARILGAKNVEVIPIYGVNTSIFKPQKKDGKLVKKLGLEGKKVVFTAARLTAEKGVGCLVKAMDEVRKTIPEAVLLIVGRGEEEGRIKCIIKEFKLEETVKLLGYVDHEKIVPYYNICDVFVLPSFIEGLGFASAEALACEKPVIGSNVGGVPDIVVDGKTGILVTPKDINGLADAIIKLLHNPSLAKKLGKAGRKHIIENFETRKVMAKLKGCIKNLGEPSQDSC